MLGNPLRFMGMEPQKFADNMKSRRITCARRNLRMGMGDRRAASRPAIFAGDLFLFNGTGVNRLSGWVRFTNISQAIGRP